MQNKKGLAYKLTRVVVLTAFILGLLMSCFQILLDFYKTQKQQSATINQIVQVMEKSFASAVLKKDILLINDLIVGLFNYQSIYTAAVFDKDGTQMVSTSRGLKKNTKRWLSDLIFL